MIEWDKVGLATIVLLLFLAQAAIFTSLGANSIKEQCEKANLEFRIKQLEKES